MYRQGYYYNRSFIRKYIIHCRALIAVINAVKPGIAPNASTLDPTKHHSNCSLAIKVADIHLKIPRIVSPENLSSGSIDEKSMMTYLSYFVESSRAKLLKWVRKALPHTGITNFTSDWFDGKFFSALVNSCFPGTRPNWMKITEETAAKSLTELYKVCLEKLGFQPHFSTSDLLQGKVEELQVMTLIMQIRNSELKSLPEAVVVSGPGIEHARLNKEAFFFIDTNEAGPGKLVIDSYYEEDGKRVKFKLEEKVSGVLTLSYRPPSLGRITFDILWSDEPVLNNPFKVEVTDSSLIQILDFEHHSKLREVGKPIQLRLNTKQSGRANLRAHLSYKSEKIEAKLTVIDDSIVEFEYTPPKAGNPTLHIFLNKKELKHLSLQYTVADVGGYVVSKLPENRVYHTFEEAVFCVDSPKNLPLNILQMTAVLTSAIQLPIKFKSVSNNRGTASFKPTLSGVYTIEVLCVDTYVQGSPFKVEVSDPLSCRLHGKLPEFLELNKPYTFELDTKEAGVGDVSFHCVEKDTPSLFKTNFASKENEHLKQLVVTPLAEGEHLVGIKYHDRFIASSPFRVQVCDPTKFEVHGDLVEKKIDVVGKPLRFKITSPDKIDPELKPVVKASGPSAKYSPKARLDDNDSSTMNVHFTPHEIGTHEISITYGGFHIPSSPFLIAVIEFDSNSCSASGAGLQEAFTNIPAQFVILTRTAGLVDNGTLQVKITGVLKDIECRVRIRDNKNGLYNVAYIATAPGAYLIHVLAGDSHITGSPFKLHVQPGPEPEKCKVHGPALEEGAVLVIGQPIDFCVDASQGGSGKLTVKAVGPGGVHARAFIAKSSKRGVFDIKLDPARHGKYRVNVKWSDNHVPGSPFILKIFPGVDPSKCKAYGPGLENGLVGAPTSFTIETRDAGPGTLKVCLHRVKDAFKIDLKPKDPKDARTLIARYFPRKPGDYLISILWTDKHIPGSPFKVKITGEPMEDDFRPNKYNRPTSRIEELQAIEEEDEDEDDFDNETVNLDSDFEVASVISRPRHSKTAKSGLRSSTSLDENTLPMFNAQASRKGYHDTFVHGGLSKRAQRDAKSLSKLQTEKMMTFRSLQQLRKPKRGPTPPVSGRGAQTGEFHGQASLSMKAKHKK